MAKPTASISILFLLNPEMTKVEVSAVTTITQDGKNETFQDTFEQEIEQMKIGKITFEDLWKSIPEKFSKHLEKYGNAFGS